MFSRSHNLLDKEDCTVDDEGASLQRPELAAQGTLRARRLRPERAGPASHTESLQNGNHGRQFHAHLRKLLVKWRVTSSKAAKQGRPTLQWGRGIIWGLDDEPPLRA